MNDKDNDFIVDDLLNLNNDDNLLQEQNKILSEMKKENLLNEDLSNTLLDPKSDSFVSIIKENVNFCVEQLKDVNETMDKISNQKNSEMFFRKSENIKLISQYMAKMANVNQKTLDLLILLLGASGKISDDYETILKTLDELGDLNKGEAEVLSYLLKVKKMIYEIRDNDTKLKQVIENCNNTMEIVNNADEAFKIEIKESEKSRKLVESKCNRLKHRIRLNNLYIGICFILIVALAIFIGVKFYVL